MLRKRHKPGRDRHEAAAGLKFDEAWPNGREAIRSIGVTEVAYYRRRHRVSLRLNFGSVTKVNRHRTKLIAIALTPHRGSPENLHEDCRTGGAPAATGRMLMVTCPPSTTIF